MATDTQMGSPECAAWFEDGVHAAAQQAHRMSAQACVAGWALGKACQHQHRLLPLPASCTHLRSMPAWRQIIAMRSSGTSAAPACRVRNGTARAAAEPAHFAGRQCSWLLQCMHACPSWWLQCQAHKNKHKQTQAHLLRDDDHNACAPAPAPAMVRKVGAAYVGGVSICGCASSAALAMPAN